MIELKPAPDALQPRTSGTRSNIVDIVKGIAIILVTYGHTAQGMVHRRWWVGPGAVFSHAFVYSFHMPAFFFMSGLFVMNSLAKRGPQRFAIDKIKTILYPYVLVVCIDAAMGPLVRRFKFSTDSFHWKVFLARLADGEANWFLFVLFLTLMLAMMTARMSPWMRFVFAVLAGLLPAFGPQSLNQVLHEFCFLAAGMWLGTRIHLIEKIPAATAASGLIFLTAFQLAMIWIYGPSALFPWIYIVLGLTGTAGLLLLARLLDHRRFGDGLAWIGRASLGIFLLSAYGQGAAREVLLRVFHTQEFWLQLLVPTMAATLLPAIVWYQRDRLRVGWLFRWPF